MVRKIFSSYFLHTLRGFTLVELLVGIGVMTIILGVTLSGSPAAILKLTLSDLAYQSELLVREAQLQGSAINSLNGSVGGMGVFFDRATSTKVLKFKDTIDITSTEIIKTGNGVFEISSPGNESDTFVTLTHNIKIGKLCVATSTVSTTSIMCNDLNSPPINTLSVVFQRPKQTAHIYINNSTSTEYALACIQFDSNKSPTFGFVKSLFIYSSGMIIKNSKTCQS